MQEIDDQQLLACYVAKNSDAAFAELVIRHINLVHLSALRQTSSTAAAEEISQAVFITLARKAHKLPRRTVLPGWLYQTTRLTAANYMRAERRRLHREHTAYMQASLSETDGSHPDETAAAWNQIAPLLDDALAALGRQDRDALVLRFFENRTTREIATALHLEEAAAHKRVERALLKLRKHFLKRGVALSAIVHAGSTFVVSGLIVPAALANSVTVAALGKGATAAASTITLVNGTIKWMVWTQFKSALTMGLAMLLTAGAVSVIVGTISADDENIDAKIASLDKPGTTAEDAIRVLGKPAAYANGIHYFDPYHLPASYNISYTNGVEVWILQGKVRELQSLRPGPGFSYHHQLRLGSPLADVLREVGPPAQTILNQPAKSVLGKSLGGEPNIFYQNLDGIPGYGYYWQADQNVRFLFRNNLVIAILMDVPA